MNKSETKKILLVEDEALIGMAESRQLEEKGYTVRHVFRGEEAIQAVLENRTQYDVILMDIDLGSGIDGTEASEIILAKMDIPIIFLSSHTEPEVVEKTEKISSYGYVVKNSGIIVLDASIKMALRLFDAKMLEREKDKSLTAMAHMLDVAPSSITVHDTEGDFLYANMKTFELHGYNREEFLKIKLQELDVPESAALREERFRLIFREGKIFFEAAHYKKDGTILPLEVTAKTVDWQGQPAILSIATDISARKEQEKALRMSEERVHALLQANPDIMFLFDFDGYFVDSHASDEKRYLLPRESFLGKHVTEVLPEYLARLTLEKLRELYEKGKALTYEYRIEQVGELFYFETRLVPCGTKNALAIVRDITEQKQDRDYQRSLQLWFQQAFTHAAIGVCFVGLDGKFIKSNSSLQETLGYSEEEMKKQSFQDITHPGDLSIGEAYFEKMMKGELDRAIFEKRYLHKNGSVVHASVATTLIRDTHNKPEYFVTQIVDITGYSLSKPEH